MDGEPGSEYTYRAVSVFDQWLGPERLSELDIHGEERVAKIAALDRFNRRVVESAEPHRIEIADARRDDGVVVRPFQTPAEALSYVKQSAEHESSESFFRVLLPPWRAVYLEGWDFTNVFYLRDLARIEALDALASECGLFVLERNW